MARPKYYPHPDANQPQMIDDLLALGFVVIDCSRWADVFDLLVYGPDIETGKWLWRPVEVKTDSGALTEQQEAFLELYPGSVVVAREAEDVLEAFGRA